MSYYDEDDTERLWDAIKSRSAEFILEALSGNPDLNIIYDGKTALQHIIYLRNILDYDVYKEQRAWVRAPKEKEIKKLTEAIYAIINNSKRDISFRYPMQHSDLELAMNIDDTELLIKLLEKNPPYINGQIHTESTTPSDHMTLLLYAVKKQNAAMVKALLEKGADPYIGHTGSYKATAFGLAIKSNNIPIMKEFLAANIDLNRMVQTNEVPLYTAIYYNAREPFELLIENGVDVNYENSALKYQTALILAAAKKLYHIIEPLLAAGANPSYKDTNGKTAADYVTDPVIKARLLSAIDEYNEKQPKWAGWTRSDVDKLNTIFVMDAEYDNTGQLKKARPANDYACCPVCLQHVERESACMYMKHKCHDPTNPQKFYHKELYNKYKNPEGEIYWCTICGRIALGHKHYALVLPDKPVPELLPSGDPFAIDCREITNDEGILETHNGGGLPEKAMRFRRLREYALLLDDAVGKMTEDQALRELVEAMWKAPLEVEHVPTVEGILATKKWNISPSKFRADVAPVAENTVQTFWPDVPEEGAKHTIVKNVGVIADDPYTGDENQQIYHFSYEGEPSNAGSHANTTFGKPGLLGFIKNHNNSHGMDTFGNCLVVGCPTKIHPNVIRDLFLDKSEPDPTKRAEYRNAYITYRKHYNYRFRDKKKDGHKSNFRIHKGARHNIFSEADDAVCVVDDEFAKEPMRPQDGGRNRRMTRHRMHTRQTHKMRARKTRNGKNKVRARKTRNGKHKHKMLRVRITRKAK